MSIRRLAAAGALLLVLVACGGPGGSDRAGTDDLAVQVASYDLSTGAPTRFIVGLITADQRLIGYGTVDLRFSYVGTKEGGADPTPFGPVVKASYLPIHGSVVPSPPPATAEIVRSSDTRGVYGAQTTFDKAGFWEVKATAMVEGKAQSGKGAFAVNPDNAVPGPGDQALATETFTLTTPDVPRPAIDSRAGSGEIPDPDLHRRSIAASLAAKRPIVAVFATPVYCTSRFCGPITDAVSGFAKRYGDRMAFVHLEVWRNYEKNELNPSAREWIDVDGDAEGSEPWTFVVGSDGLIKYRFDNVAGEGELEAAIRQVLGA